METRNSSSRMYRKSFVRCPAFPASFNFRVYVLNIVEELNETHLLTFRRIVLRLCRNVLSAEFQYRFGDIKLRAISYRMIENPLQSDENKTPEIVRLELVDLKIHFMYYIFYTVLPDGFPKIKEHCQCVYLHYSVLPVFANKRFPPELRRTFQKVLYISVNEYDK